MKQLVAPGRIGIVRIEEDRRENAAAEIVTPVRRKCRPSSLSKNLDAVGAEIQPDLAVVLDHAADVPLERLALLVDESAPASGPGCMRSSTRSLVGDEAVVDEELLVIGDVEGAAPRNDSGIKMARDNMMQILR